MKSISQISSLLLIFFFLFSNFQTVLGQNILETNAVLLEATIYGRGASLHHTADEISLPNGNSEIVINQIAQNIDPQSIRVSAKSNHITILSVSFERDYLVKGENSSPKYLELKEKYEESQATLDELTNARKAEESSLALLEENRKFGGQSGVSPTSMANMIKYYREAYKNIASRIIELKNEEKEQQKVVAKLMKQIQEAGGNGQNAGQLVVRLNANQPVRTNFDVHYFTNNVFWTPFYEIRMDNLNKPLQLNYKANVSQNTGIDWMQVKLAFSSGNPQRNNNAPELNPWWVGYQNRIGYNGLLQNKTSGVVVENLEESVVEQDMVVVQENQLTTSFVVNTPYDVYSNQKPQAVQLKQYQLPAKYSYFTAPRLDETAFLVAKVSDWSKYNLLPGNANLIIDNNFAGSSHIDPNSTQDSLRLSLGRDERIVSKRERIDEEGSTSFFGNSQKRIYTYEISVKNTRSEAIEIEVKEQFPLSTEKDIEIKLLETAEAKIDNEKGVLTWNLALKAGETKKLRYSYSVKLPKDKQLSGM